MLHAGAKCVHTYHCAQTGLHGSVCRPAALRCKSTATGAEQATIIQQLLTRRSYAPPRFVGPVKVSRVPGKRYGLTATQNLPMGALLLVVPPLIAAYGSWGAAPSNIELVSLLEGQQLDPWRLQWLTLLHRQPTAAAAAAATAVSSTANNTAIDSNHRSSGADAIELSGQQLMQDSSAAQQQEQADSSGSSQLALLQQLLLQGNADTHQDTGAAATDGETAAAAAVGIASVTCPFTQEQLEQIIAENAYSEPSEDLGAALLRELDPEAITGLWPEYALLNHSCAPNTVAVVVGQYLLLRATAPVMAGEELTGSYLGVLGFAPVALRRAYLAGVYGFHCQCDRCMTEQSTFPTVYYPADNNLLGIVDPNKPSSNSNSSDILQQQQQQHDGWISKTLALLGLGGGSSSKVQQKQPHPSKQNQLLVQLHTEAAELQIAVEDAVRADSRRQERQLALLQDITHTLDRLLDAVNDVSPQLQERSFAQSPGTARNWLVAAVCPLLKLQVELLETLLSSGELPVDDQYLLYQDSNSTRAMTSGSARGVAAAGAAAAARLSFAKRSSRSSTARPSGLSGLLTGWGYRPDDDAGPITKRQLLGLYVESLERSVQAVDSVGRGSETHVVLALKYMDAARQLYGAESEETRLAEGLCSRAHAARYGVMNKDKQQLLAALISARRRQLLGVSLARKMSVLAWESATARD